MHYFSYDDVVAIATKINRSYDLVAEVLKAAGFQVSVFEPGWLAEETARAKQQGDERMRSAVEKEGEKDEQTP